LFQKDGDYQAFERVLAEALQRHPIRLLGYCLMPNHWHLVLWPDRPMRWHTHYATMGTGHLYQGRFKSFPVAEDDHLYRLLRYVERNALRANLVARAEAWLWSSLWRRQNPEARPPSIALADWPVAMPKNWLGYVNGAETEAELEALRRCVCRGAPYGTPAWQQQTARQLRIEYTLRPRGRPKKTTGK
jgi:putative transposase